MKTSKKKVDVWAYFAPMANGDLRPYRRWLAVTVLLVSVCFFYLLWVLMGVRPNPAVPEMQIVGKAVAISMNIMCSVCLSLIIHLLVFSLVAPFFIREVFKIEWKHATGSEWVDCEHNPWAIHDDKLAFLAMLVDTHVGDATELKKLFWHARLLAGVLEDAHPFTGKTRVIGDISHYVKLYRSQVREHAD